MKNIDCPYMRRDGTCSNKHMNIADCIYINRPEKCPILRESSAWSSVCRFFKRKSIPKPINPPKNTTGGLISNGI